MLEIASTALCSTLSLTIRSSTVGMMRAKYMYISIKWELEVVKRRAILVKHRLDILALAEVMLGTFALKFFWNYFFPTFKMGLNRAGFICFIAVLLIRSSV